MICSLNILYSVRHNSTKQYANRQNLAQSLRGATAQSHHTNTLLLRSILTLVLNSTGPVNQHQAQPNKDESNREIDST